LFVDGFYKSAQLRILGVFPIDQAVGRELNADKGKLQRRFKKNGVQIQIVFIHVFEYGCAIYVQRFENGVVHGCFARKDEAAGGQRQRDGHAGNLHCVVLLRVSRHRAEHTERQRRRKGAGVFCKTNLHSFRSPFFS